MKKTNVTISFDEEKLTALRRTSRSCAQGKAAQAGEKRTDTDRCGRESLTTHLKEQLITNREVIDMRKVL